MESLEGQAKIQGPGKNSDPAGNDAAILKDRVDMLYSSTGLSLVVSLAVAVIFVVVYANAGRADSGHYAWLGALGLVLSARLGLNLLHHHHPGRHDAPAWLRFYRGGALLTATCWGLAGALFLDPGDEAIQMFTILVIAGIAAGSLTSLATDYITYRAYVGISLMPAAAVTLALEDRLQTAIGLLILLLMVFLLRSGRRTADSILHSLRLRHENAALLGELGREKHRLRSESEAMMGTVLACAPIALWSIDRQGIFTYVDGGRLEQQTGIRLPRTGDNLFDHFARFETVLRDARCALRGEEIVSEVKIQQACFEVHYSPLFDDHGGQAGAIGVAIDITERKTHQQELERRANFDPLTGLANRTLAMDSLHMAFARARRKQTLVGIFFLDLDNFKTINDTLGRQAGDTLLCSAAQRVQQCLRESDLAARISGDEFLVIAEGLTEPSDAEVLGHKLVDVFQSPFALDGRRLYLTTSTGMAVYPRDGTDATQLMQCAETAMYHAKDSGKNQYRFFTQKMQQAALRHLQIETELRLALQNRELELYYQPKVDIQRNVICGAEALLRWDSGALGRVGPDEFVPVAEVAGLMPQIGDWILSTACSEAASWQRTDGLPVQVAINVSPQQFRKTDLLANVTEALVGCGLPASSLELEITESLLVQDSASVLDTLNSLRELGISLALDDFGTGYSSLSYLRKFPLQVLKIDQAFVRELGEDADNEALVNAIVNMARSLRMETVAEGVESSRQLQYLQARGVDKVQGYFYSKPLPAEQFRELLSRPGWPGVNR